MPLGRRTGPWPGSRIEEGGLRKKKGFLGRTLFSSLMWSLSGVSAGGSQSILGAQIGDAGGWERLEGFRGALIRIISSNADDFATICCNTTRGHYQ